MEKIETLDLDSISGRLRFIRKSKGLGQKEFGELVEMKTRTIAGYEREERKISVEAVIQICQKCHVSFDFLLLGKDIHAERMNKLVQAQENTSFKINNKGGRVEVTLSIPVIPELEEN